ncbi:hypothetical protein DRN67_04555 [Candidatus Micrarchaeota archaeon]|nr:MAG: hypothetical protein DRN67_04555 [Candidatus Micrarchaeota archaeon]
MQVNRGFYLSTEAIISLLLLGALLALETPKEKPGLTELHILQKENDLLRTWLLEGSFDEKAMEQDFLALFPNSAGIISMDGKETIVGRRGSTAIASRLVFFDSALEKHEIELIVFD